MAIKARRKMYFKYRYCVTREGKSERERERGFKRE